MGKFLLDLEKKPTIVRKFRLFEELEKGEKALGDQSISYGLDSGNNTSLFSRRHDPLLLERHNPRTTECKPSYHSDQLRQPHRHAEN